MHGIRENQSEIQSFAPTPNDDGDDDGDDDAGDDEREDDDAMQFVFYTALAGL